MEKKKSFYGLQVGNTKLGLETNFFKKLGNTMEKKKKEIDKKYYKK